jgi:ribonucleotide reductase beta subunit family protein with ferritin-like domain
LDLNANILKDFVDYTAADALKQIGIKYAQPHPKSTPIPWFNKHSDTSKKQTASTRIMSQQTTSLELMGENLDYDALPAI